MRSARSAMSAFWAIICLPSCGGGDSDPTHEAESEGEAEAENEQEPAGQMYRCLHQCASNQDCPITYSCVDGGCTFTGCTANAGCKEKGEAFSCFTDSDNINRCWVRCESQEDCNRYMECTEGACRYASFCPTEGTCDERAKEYELTLGSICMESQVYPMSSCRFPCLTNTDCERLADKDDLAECREGSCVPHGCDPTDSSACTGGDDPNQVCALTVWDGDI